MKSLADKRVVLVALTLGLGLSACTVTGHHGGGTVPKEPGQAAFGALAEIVETLNRDSNTDWEKVDIDGLRRHLVDMNELTLNAKVRTEQREGSVVFHVSGSGNTLRAIQAMVPAHANQLMRSLNWKTETHSTKDGVIFTISSSEPNQLLRLKALGFFGVMATGSHHQVHHLQMATGKGHSH